MGNPVPSPEYRLLMSIIDSGNKELLVRMEEKYFLHATDKEKVCDFLRFLKEFTRNTGSLPTKSTAENYGFYSCDVFKGFEAYYDDVLSTYKRNYILKKMAEITSVVGTNINTAENYLKEALDELRNTSVVKGYSSKTEEDYTFLDTLKRETSLARKGGINFGWPTLDASSDGQCPGDLTSVVARTGIGKTMILLYMAVAAWMSGNRVLFCSLEMTEQAIIRRLNGMCMGLNPRRFKSSTFNSLVGIKCLEKMIESHEELPGFNFVKGKSKRSVDKLEDVVRALNPDILFVDSAYKILPSRFNPVKSSSGWENIKASTEGLYEVAVDNKISIVASYQLNKGAVKSQKVGEDVQDRMGTHNIAGSDAIGHNSTFVISVRKGEGVEKETKRILTLEKSRESETGIYTTINYNTNTMDFTECSAGFYEGDDI